MKLHTTNYKDTLIEIAEDCPTNKGTIPPLRGDKKSVANLQFELLSENPYQYTSDDIFFHVFATRKEIQPKDIDAQRAVFFSKGQPCFRASPLTKRYGWGVHSNNDGKIALYGAESNQYKALLENEEVRKLKAMRSKRK